MLAIYYDCEVPVPLIMKVTCDRCGGDNISQSASLMIDLKEVMSNTYAFDWNDLCFEDYYYCQDCADEVAVNEEEE